MLLSYTRRQFHCCVTEIQELTSYEAEEALASSLFQEP